MKIEGESTVVSYAANGGISLMSVDEIPPGTVTGGSGDSEGSAGSVTRIRWTISFDGTSYSGGITNVSWFRHSEGEVTNEALPVDGPFEGVTDEQIYLEASRTGNLDSYFNNWNSSAGDTILQFQMYVYQNAPGCITIGGIGG